MSKEEIKKEIEECKKQGMPDFMVCDHINDLLMEEESEVEE